MKKEMSEASKLLLQKHKQKELSKSSQLLLQKQQEAELNKVDGSFRLQLLQHLANQKKEEANERLLFPWLYENSVHRKT